MAWGAARRRRARGLDVRGVVDLSLLARSVDNRHWRGKYNSPIGLARLVEVYHYRLLDKGKTTRSNWERSLDEKQQLYAANDAFAAYSLYEHLLSLADPATPLNPLWYSFDTKKGAFWETATGLTWRPHNPNYDPGPAPPPRPKKERKPRLHKNSESQANDNGDVYADPKEGEPLEERRMASIAAIAQATKDRQSRSKGPNASSADDPTAGAEQSENRLPAERRQRRRGYPRSQPSQPSSSRETAQGPSRPDNSRARPSRRGWNRGGRPSRSNTTPGVANTGQVDQPQLGQSSGSNSQPMHDQYKAHPHQYENNASGGRRGGRRGHNRRGSRGGHVASSPPQLVSQAPV